MILKASQRSGGKQLGHHLLRTDENEIVEVHEVRGFVSESVLGAMQEAYALSRATRCRQYLFSLSLNPPEGENVAVETFEHALASIEERVGLTGQPRIVVFHEKEGRRHAHAVWSRIDATTMTARHMSFFKTKLQEISRQLFLENGWRMPRGLVERGAGDPRNFTLDEWQKAKRLGNNPQQTKELVQQCWAASDTRSAFESALSERGLYLAKGDRRGRVIVSFEGEVLSLSRALGRTEKELSAKLGAPDSLHSIEETRAIIRDAIGPRLRELVKIARKNAASALLPLLNERKDMAARHRAERHKLDAGQAERWRREVSERAARLRTGLRGLWDRLNGERAKAIAKNEFEAIQAIRRDRSQRDSVVRDQLAERRRLQAQIKSQRREAANLIVTLIKDHMRLGNQVGSSERGARAAFARTTHGRGHKNRGRDFDLGPS